MTKVRAGSSGKSTLQGRHQRRGLQAGKSACVREEMSAKNKLISLEGGWFAGRQLQEAALRCRVR